MGLLNDKIAIVFGVANHRSIAWGIAQAFHREGAKLILTYQGERVEKSVRDLADTLTDVMTLQCDVTDDAQIADCFKAVQDKYGRLDALVHSVAYAKKEDLEGRFIETTKEGFETALGVSAYSLVAVTRGALPLMKEGSSVVTMSFAGSVRAYPNYNVMGVAKAALESSVRYLASDLGPGGIRVNTISAGPISTLSARGISGFTGMLKESTERMPLRRTVTTDEIGNAAVFLCSDMGSGMTGETIYVDSGLNSVGV